MAESGPYKGPSGDLVRCALSRARNLSEELLSHLVDAQTAIGANAVARAKLDPVIEMLRCADSKLWLAVEEVGANGGFRNDN